MEPQEGPRSAWREVQDDVHTPRFQRPKRHLNLPSVRSPRPHGAFQALLQSRQHKAPTWITHGSGAVGPLNADPHKGLPVLDIHDHAANDAVSGLSLGTGAERSQKQRSP